MKTKELKKLALEHIAPLKGAKLIDVRSIIDNETMEIVFEHNGICSKQFVDARK